MENHHRITPLMPVVTEKNLQMGQALKVSVDGNVQKCTVDIEEMR